MLWDCPLSASAHKHGLAAKTVRRSIFEHEFFQYIGHLRR